MRPINEVDVRARGVSADALDAIRPLARQRGYAHTNNDTIRFAVLLAASIAQSREGAAIAELCPQRQTKSLADVGTGNTVKSTGDSHGSV